MIGHNNSGRNDEHIIEVGKIIGDYVYLKSTPEIVARALMTLHEVLGKGGEDLEDALRIIENFDAFYEIARKKFKDYIATRKNTADLIKGRVLVDKVKLTKEGSQKHAIAILDRSIKLDDVLKTLTEAGFRVLTASSGEGGSGK